MTPAHQQLGQKLKGMAIGIVETQIIWQPWNTVETGRPPPLSLSPHMIYQTGGITHLASRAENAVAMAETDMLDTYVLNVAPAKPPNWSATKCRHPGL